MKVKVLGQARILKVVVLDAALGNSTGSYEDFVY